MEYYQTDDLIEYIKRNKIYLSNDELKYMFNNHIKHIFLNKVHNFINTLYVVVPSAANSTVSVCPLFVLVNCLPYTFVSKSFMNVCTCVFVP